MLGQTLPLSHNKACLAAYLPSHSPAAPCRRFGWGKVKVPTAKEVEEEKFWRQWADEKLVKVLTVNLYSSLRESYQAMEYIMDVHSFSYLSRLVGYGAGGMVMYAVGTRLPKKYGLEGKDLRAELVKLVDEFVDAGVSLVLLCA
jgi:hypothetical protein